MSGWVRITMLPLYPMIERDKDGWLVHTKEQAEAGNVKAKGARIPCGRVNEHDRPHEGRTDP